MKILFTIMMALATSACVSPEQIAAKQAKQYAMFKAINENTITSCDSKKKCDAIFRVAVDMVTSYSDMKIQSQGENNISTYNPFNYGSVGMSAQRTLSAGTAENITLNVYCKGMSETLLPLESCFERVTAIYGIYRTKISQIEVDKKNEPKKRGN